MLQILASYTPTVGRILTFDLVSIPKEFPLSKCLFFFVLFLFYLQASSPGFIISVTSFINAILFHPSTSVSGIWPLGEFQQVTRSPSLPLTGKKRIDKHTLDKASTTFKHRSSNLARLFQALCIWLLENRNIVQSNGYSPHGCLFVAKRDLNSRILNHPSPDYPAAYMGNRV